MERSIPDNAANVPDHIIRLWRRTAGWLRYHSKCRRFADPNYHRVNGTSCTNCYYAILDTYQWQRPRQNWRYRKRPEPRAGRPYTELGARPRQIPGSQKPRRRTTDRQKEWALNQQFLDASLDEAEKSRRTHCRWAK
mgnify:CR=1 FL=1